MKVTLNLKRVISKGASLIEKKMAKKNFLLGQSMRELIDYADDKTDGFLIHSYEDGHVAQALNELESGDVARFDSYEDLLVDLNKDDQPKRIAELAKKTSNVRVIDSNEKLEEWLSENE